MTKKQAAEMFAAEVLPQIEKRERPGRVDKPMRRQAWNEYVDALHRDGLITDRQADTWVMPEKFLRKRERYNGRGNGRERVGLFRPGDHVRITKGWAEGTRGCVWKVTPDKVWVQPEGRMGTVSADMFFNHDELAHNPAGYPLSGPAKKEKVRYRPRITLVPGGSHSKGGFERYSIRVPEQTARELEDEAQIEISERRTRAGSPTRRRVKVAKPKKPKPVKGKKRKGKKKPPPRVTKKKRNGRAILAAALRRDA